MTAINKIKVLHLEDSEDDAYFVAEELKKGKLDCEIRVVDKRADFIKELSRFLPDVILSDHSLPGFNSLEALAILKYSGLKIPFILVSGYPAEDYIVSLMAEGMDDYILKDRLQRLPVAVSNALKKYHFEKELTKVMQKHATERLQVFEKQDWT
jgi:CheY-like chemotaxis protein